MLQNLILNNVGMKTILLCLCLAAPSVLLAQNFSGGFSYAIPHNDGSNAPFLPKFKARPLSEADRVTANGSKFMVGGQPYRFWGVNITSSGAFASKVSMPGIASHARKMGINLVRFHHLDNPWGGSEGSIFVPNQSTRNLNATTLDRLDFFIAELKRNGIYTNMNLNVSRTFNGLDGVANADSIKDFAKGITIFDPQLINLQKEYAQQLLTHVNPYTGLKLADDPALAVVEIINENSIYGLWKDNLLKTTKEGGVLLVRHKNRLDSLWNAFLVAKYQTQTNLQTAWQGTGGGVTERVIDGGFEGASLNANWQNELHNGAAATFGQDPTQGYAGTKSAKITVSTATGTDWNVQFKYVGFSLKKDTTYVVQFAAKASKNRVISVSLQRNDAPYTWYGGQQFNLTTAWQVFRFTVTAPENNTAAGRVSFNAGTTDGAVWIDNVSVAEPVVAVLEANENLAARNVRRVDYANRGFYTKPRLTDLSDFYINLQQRFMEDMRAYLRNTLGVRAAITGTNALVGIQEGVQHENMDFYDDHAYWDHPQFPGVAWDANNWRIDNAPMVKNGSFGAITNAFSGVYKNDKPLTISEYNHGYPNKYRAEMLPAMTAYGAFHGMDGLMFFEYNGEPDNTWAADRVNGYFAIHRDHSVMAQFPGCAFAYRNGLIAEAQPTLINYSDGDVYRSFEKDNQGRWGKYVPYDLRLQLTHSLRVGTYHHPQGITTQTLPTPASGVFQTNTQQTTLNTQTGLLTTATPNYISVAGFLQDSPNVQVGNLKVLSASDFGAITWVSLNEKPLAQADTSLLTMASRTHNAGMVWNAQNNSLNTNWGNAPTVVQPLQIAVRLTLQAEALRIHVLSPTGQVVSTKDIMPTAPNTFDAVLNQSTDQTLWYGVQAIKTKDLVLAINRPTTSVENLVVSPNPVQNNFTVEYTAVGIEPVEIIVYNAMAAAIVCPTNKIGVAGRTLVNVDVSKLPNGVYFVRVGSEVKKIMILR